MSNKKVLFRNVAITALLGIVYGICGFEIAIFTVLLNIHLKQLEK